MTGGRADGRTDGQTVWLGCAASSTTVALSVPLVGSSESNAPLVRSALVPQLAQK